MLIVSLAFQLELDQFKADLNKTLADIKECFNDSQYESMFNDTVIDIKHYSTEYAEQVNRTIISVKK